MAGTVKRMERTARLSFGELRAEAAILDGSCHILLYGGQSPYLSSTVLAELHLSFGGRHRPRHRVGAEHLRP